MPPPAGGEHSARVQNLQRNLAARLVDGIGHHRWRLAAPLVANVPANGGPARDVGRKAAGHDQAHAALGPLAEVGSQLAQIAPFFQAGVRSPSAPGFEGGVAQVQRLEQVGVRGGG